MTRNEKTEVVKKLNSIFLRNRVMLVALYRGLTVAQSLLLRRQAKTLSASVRISKNRLIKLALKDTHMNVVSEVFSGPTIMVCGDEVVGMSKLLSDFVSSYGSLSILGGVLDGEFLDAKMIKELAVLPSVDALRARLTNLIQAPSTTLARLIKEPSAQLVRVFDAYANANANDDKDESKEAA